MAACGEIITYKTVAATLAATSYGVFSSPDVNLKEKNYAAADFIAGKIKNRVRRDQIILAMPLEETDHAGISSPLGAFIPEGIGLRLGELGYNVAIA